MGRMLALLGYNLAGVAQSAAKGMSSLPMDLALYAKIFFTRIR